MDVQSLLPFLLEMDRLKTVNRQTLIHHGGRRENSAEHSWHLAVAVLLFQKLAPSTLNLERALKMALLHDMVEIDPGDIFVYDESGEKKVKELACLERLAALLPAELAQDFKTTWLEFEEGQSVEAKYVSAIDRFLPVYSNFLNEGYSWKNHGISYERVMAKNKPPITAGLPPLWEVARQLIDESMRTGSLMTSDSV